MLSINDSTLSKDRAELAARVATQVTALPNLTDDQRTKVRDIATHWAFNHGTVIQKKDVGGTLVVTYIGEPNYAGLANLVRNQA
jgi:hypothetical protein